jgi:UDP-N-acetylglucosamine 4,6-dehydratase/5-epimerase
LLNDKVILVTGGTGSFGKEFVSHVLRSYTPRKLIILSRDELKQYEMQAEFPDSEHPSLRFFLGDVRDFERLKQAFNGVDYVIHAAAMKQVPASEYNPFECIKTNINGGENVINAAIYNKVKKVVALSTDKAVNPLNLYGATKLASDKIFVSGNHMAGIGGTRFSVVRYGNVMGSRGSVVPLYRKLIAAGRKDLPVTDAKMTRFAITLPQGVRFVLKSLESMQGGEIFIPKIPSLRITDLAHAMLPDAKLNFVGIRPGEKLHEVMVPADEARNTLEFDDHYVIQPALQWWDAKLVEHYRERGGKPVAEGFEYRSDNNERWADRAEILEIIGQ